MGGEREEEAGHKIFKHVHFSHFYYTLKSSQTPQTKVVSITVASSRSKNAILISCWLPCAWHAEKFEIFLVFGLSFGRPYCFFQKLTSGKRSKRVSIIFDYCYNAGHKCWDTYQNTSEQSPPPPSPPPQAMLNFDAETHIYTRKTIYLYLSTLY